MQVNFYILNDDDNQRRDHFIYRLINKTLSQHKKVWLLCDQSSIHHYDDFIWSHQPESFIPHDVIQSEQTLALLHTENQAKLGVIDRAYLNQAQALSEPDIMIDISSAGEPINFAHVMLITNQHPEILANSRLKFQSYKQINITPKVFKIDDRKS